jgi:hypothetical protein
MNNNPSPREINIYKTLNQRRHQDNTSLFGGQETSSYWTLADLTILYPNDFDISQPISTSVITKINGMVFNSIPSFRNLTPQPVHMLSFKEDYNAFVKDAHEIKIVKNGTNQKLSPVVCEYLFSQINGAEFEQAYFMCQNQQIEDVKAVANQIKFARIRNQVKELSESFSSVIKHAGGSNLNSYSDVWSYLWCRLFNVQSMDDLRQKYCLKENETILDYMTLAPLSYTHNILQEILSRIYSRKHVSIAEIKYIISVVISPDRIAQFAKDYSDPAIHYTQKNTESSMLAPINRAKTALWKKAYPVSLKQR